MNELFTRAKHIYFVGIKGVAMTAMALWAKEAGYVVSGSDVADVFPTDELLARVGIVPMVGFAEAHIDESKPELVIYTGAHQGRDNPEVKRASALGIPVLPHGKALGLVMEEKRQLSVAGSHGKTTTSAMIATLFTQAGNDPSYAIGCGEVFGLGLPGHQGTGDMFIAEADEYITEPGHDTTPRFLWQHPEILVVTNIDFDHPDAYPTLERVQEAFVKLQGQMSGNAVTILNADDPNSTVFAGHGETASVGFGEHADIRIVDVRVGDEATHFSLVVQGTSVGEFTLKVPGLHNVGNAALALVAGHQYGLSWDTMREALPVFRGTKRRFERVGDYKGAPVYDDYAHHPKEIRATLAAARQWYPNRHIIAVFQPHTYSRTKALMHDFAQAFGDADRVCLADIYASAREHDTLGISTATLIAEMAKVHPNVLYTPTVADVQNVLTTSGDKDALIICMGAGDIYGWSRKLVKS